MYILGKSKHFIGCMRNALVGYMETSNLFGSEPTDKNCS